MLVLVLVRCVYARVHVQTDAEEAGAMLATHTTVSGGEVTPDGLIRLCTRESGSTNVESSECAWIRAKYVVNAAGLGATHVAR